MLLMASIVLAVPRDRAQRDVDDAQRRLNDADARLRDALRVSQDAQRNDDDLRTRSQNLTRVIDDGQRRLEVIRRQVADATSALPALKATLANSTKTVAEKKPTTQAAMQTLDAAKATTTQIRAKAVSAFEAGSEYVAKKSATDAAQATFDDASKACLAAVERTAEYKASLAKVAADEEALHRARTAAKQDEVAAASTTWIDSKNKLENLREKALAADGDTSSAKLRLSAAKKAQRDLRETFDATLPKQPEMAAALADQSSAQSAYDKSTAELRKAVALAASSQKDITDKQAVVDNGATTIKQFETDIAARQRDLAGVTQDLAAADRRLNDALNETRNRQQDRNTAAARLRDAQVALECRALIEFTPLLRLWATPGDLRDIAPIEPAAKSRYKLPQRVAHAPTDPS